LVSGVSRDRSDVSRLQCQATRDPVNSTSLWRFNGAVEGTTLSTFANNAVRYQGNTYTFEMIYGPTTLTPLVVGFGIALAVAGGALFFLTQLIERRRTLSTGISP
jgi:hypothetical protein